MPNLSSVRRRLCASCEQKVGMTKNVGMMPKIVGPWTLVIVRPTQADLPRKVVECPTHAETCIRRP
jgi:hypothetical protein